MESFWSTEYGQNILSVEQTEIDKLLAAPNSATLEDLFDEDELLQQCSNKNTQLITFLAKQENITKLVSYITRPWQEHMTQIVNHLREEEELNKNNKDRAKPNIPSSPLSKNGLHRVSSIPEELEDKPDPLSLMDSTPQSLAETLMTLEEIGSNKEEKTAHTKEEEEPEANSPKDAINDATNTTDEPINDDECNHSIESTATTQKEDTDTQQTSTATTATTKEEEEETDEFNHYDDLKLSDDDDDEEEAPPPAKEKEEEEADAVEEDSKEKEKEKDEAPSPSLKKKRSVVDMLCSGPNFSDKEQQNTDADPELPDFDVSKKPQLGGSNASDDVSDDEIPPPPPPPAQPSRLEEFESELGIEKVKLKYPYLASEIINCQIPQILDTILNENNPFLDMLFDFIQQKPPLNAVLTNYWRSCVVGLVRRNSAVILKYIKSRKNLLSCLVQHIRDQSIMELVIALGWDPAIEELKELDEVADWMNEQRLVPKLIATLAPTRTPDEHSAASYTLVDIVAKTSRSTNLVLFYNLASEVQIAALMNHMFAGNRSSLLESLSVLLALLHHYPNVSAEKQQFGDEYNPNDPDNTRGDRDIPPPPPGTHVVESIGIDGGGVALMTTNPLAPKQSQSAEENNHGDAQEDTNNIEKSEESIEIEIETEKEEKAEEKEKLEFSDNIPAVVRAVCYRLSDFKILLETAPSQSLKLPFVTLAPPLGPVRHKVVDMIVALMRTPSDVVSGKLRSLGLIVQCIDLFFLYPWNNLLHGSVEHIIQMVVSGECSILKKALFEDCDFLNRILSARHLSATHQETKKFRLGYMGHITRVSNTIVEFAKRNQQLLDYMESNKDWMKFIADDLKLENEQLNTQLGGHRPSALNGDDGDNEDFTLFTLNDINNPDPNDGEHTHDGEEDEDEEEEEDHDSDSDSDEETHAAVQQHLNQMVQNNLDILKSETNNNNNYEMPQEAFNKLTQNIDENDKKMQQKQKENENENANLKKDDFDEWFNDADSWNDFDNNNNNDNKKEKETETEKEKETEEDKEATPQNKIIKQAPPQQPPQNDKRINADDSSQQNKAAATTTAAAEDDFDNWDNDPFSDDLFATDDINKKAEANANVNANPTTNDTNDDNLKNEMNGHKNNSNDDTSVNDD